MRDKVGHGGQPGQYNHIVFVQYTILKWMNAVLLVFLSWLLQFILLVKLACGDWFGKIWIPSHSTIYNYEMMHKSLQGQSILVIGDSLARRLATTLYYLCSYHKNPVLHLDAEFLRPKLRIGGHSKHVWVGEDFNVTYVWAPTMSKIVQSDNMNISWSNYTTVVVSLGDHDVLQATRLRVQNQSTVKQISYFKPLVTQALTTLTKNTRCDIIWRSTPYQGLNISVHNASDYKFASTNLLTDQMNGCVRREIENLNSQRLSTVVTYLPFHESLQGLDYGTLRGDSAQHLDESARFALVQQIIFELRKTSFGRCAKKT